MELEQLAETKDALIDVAVVFNEDGSPASGFKIVGANSDQYRDAERQWRLGNVKRAARRAGVSGDLATDEGAGELVSSLAKRDEVIALAVVIELYGFTDKGAPVARSEDALRRIFKARPTWVAKIVNAAEAESGFTKASSAG